MGLQETLFASLHGDDTRRLSGSELLSVETLLYERVQEVPPSARRVARIRLYAIFILLRYGALRLPEISALTSADLSLENDCVTVKDASHPRTVCLPPTICRRLRALFSPGFFPFVDSPLRINPATVRHAFARCARICRLSPGLCNARTIRASRVSELEHLGLPFPLVQVYLGRSHRALSESDRELLTSLCRKETPLLTSARNVFQGRVDEVQETGIMVRVRLKTSSGLAVTSLITDQSCRRLGIVRGRLLSASIKAPWVSIQRRAVCSGSDNLFQARVSTVRHDAFFAEVTAVLADGSLVCALETSLVDLPEPDERVLVAIPPLAVVLHADFG